GTGHVHAICDIVGRGEADAEIVAIADVCDIHANNAADVVQSKRGNRPDVYRDYRELLARDDIHGVLNATPEHWHAKVAIDAIVAGKDIYSEKPMTLNLADALALRAAAKANPDVICQIGTQKIMLPKYRAAKKLIDDGAIGVPVFSQTSYCRNTPNGEWNYYQLNPDWKPGENLDWKMWLGDHKMRPWDPKIYARWRRYSEFSTGIIGDLLVHEITPMYMALENAIGWPTRVVATGSHMVDKDMDNHDLVNLEIQYESGHQMVVAGATCNEVGLENLIRGNKANIYLNSRHCEMRPTRPYVDEVDPQTIECPDIGNDQDELRKNWFRVMRSREEPDSNVERGTRVMVAVDLATRSMWTGRAWAFDHENLTVRAL
ncbi:MAG: Gfo/Idh/MocA family oxidoreductase, partial [Phycisphaerales bacterium]|nr:Gfo/Idh/MocA family oxidoreductase [Phycisphaerales bacterium]